MGIWSFSGKGKLMIAFGNSKWCANDECDRLERHGLGGGGGGILKESTLQRSSVFPFSH